MYATRIPFEESTVYSQINIKYPNLKKFKLFKVNEFLLNKFLIFNQYGY
jgi:hypothetical protein